MKFIKEYLAPPAKDVDEDELVEMFLEDAQDERVFVTEPPRVLKMPFQEQSSAVYMVWSRCAQPG